MRTLASDIERAASPALAACHRLTLPAQQPPWTRTGIHLDSGQSYTLLAAGRVLWSARHPHLYGGPGFHLWARISPGGRIVNLTRDSGSFSADCSGELELGIYLGMWLDAYGGLATPASAYQRLSGELEVLVLVWRGVATACRAWKISTRAVMRHSWRWRLRVCANQSGYRPTGIICSKPAALIFIATAVMTVRHAFVCTPAMTRALCAKRWIFP